MTAKGNIAKLISTTLVTNDSAPPYPFAHQFKQTTALESEGCPHRPTHSSNITPGLQPSGDIILSLDKGRLLYPPYLYSSLAFLVYWIRCPICSPTAIVSVRTDTGAVSFFKRDGPSQTLPFLRRKDLASSWSAILPLSTIVTITMPSLLTKTF
eukprot:XP_011673919.1 PREDICTED: uncharacterized protein LOC105442936 [Strongylocentrotus purpuratus]